MSVVFPIKTSAINYFRITATCSRQTNNIKRRASIIQKVADDFEIGFQFSDVNIKKRNVLKSLCLI